MVTRNPRGALTNEEKKIVKALLAKGWRNQDIQALINIERPATVNGARITEVKKDDGQRLATDDELEFYQIRKRSFDPITRLNLYDDERLVRAREAMILAVQIFNSAALQFKTEVLAVLSNVAWTYLMHEYYVRKKVKIEDSKGHSLLLSQMIKRKDCPLSEGVKNNIRSLKTIRDDVEHKLLGRSDVKWLGLFQSCCLNFDKVICELFGDDLTLSKELSFALQFSQIGIDQISQLNRYEIPAHIEALDARLEKGKSAEQLSDLEYQFRVVYTIDAASKGRSHIEFLRPDSVEGKEVRNVLVQYKSADNLYPLKPTKVVAMVHERTGKKFTSHNHTQAWRRLGVRPRSNARQPENTNKEYCIYHPIHGDYTYSEKWVDRLVAEVMDEAKFEAIRTYRV